MNSGTYTTEFGSFLKRHRCAKAYFYELKRRQPDVALFFSCHIPENYLCCAFAYHKSIKGWNYWNKIEEMWTEELDNLKNKKS